jgi:hypothetical protein
MIEADRPKIMTQLLGILGLLGVAAFVVFAFRQGMAVKPEGREDQGLSIRPSDFDPRRWSP